MTAPWPSRVPKRPKKIKKIINRPPPGGRVGVREREIDKLNFRSSETICIETNIKLRSTTSTTTKQFSILTVFSWGPAWVPRALGDPKTRNIIQGYHKRRRTDLPHHRQHATDFCCCSSSLYKHQHL